MNHEGYTDPTADKAVNNTQMIPRELAILIKQIRSIAEAAGYEIPGRIVFRDEGGREWR